MRIALRTEAFLIEQRWSSRGVAGGRVGLDLDVLVLQLGADGLFGGHQLDGDGDLLVRAGADVDDGDLFVQDDDEGFWWWPDGRDRCAGSAAAACNPPAASGP